MANQSKLDKDHKMSGFRSDKAYSLKVKAFSSLLFHRNEMTHLRLNMRRYRFFRINRVFRMWSLFVIKKQEHAIKLNFFRKRWDLIHKNQVIDQWRAITLKWRHLYQKFDLVVRMGANHQQATYFQAWRHLYRQKWAYEQALKFRSLKALKSNTSHSRNITRLHQRRLELILRNQVFVTKKRVFDQLARFKALLQRSKRLRTKTQQQVVHSIFRFIWSEFTRCQVNKMKHQLGALS